MKRAHNFNRAISYAAYGTGVPVVIVVLGAIVVAIIVLADIDVGSGLPVHTRTHTHPYIHTHNKSLSMTSCSVYPHIGVYSVTSCDFWQQFLIILAESCMGSLLLDHLAIILFYLLDFQISLDRFVGIRLQITDFNAPLLS